VGCNDDDGHFTCFYTYEAKVSFYADSILYVRAHLVDNALLLRCWWVPSLTRLSMLQTTTACKNAGCNSDMSYSEAVTYSNSFVVGSTVTCW